MGCKQTNVKEQRGHLCISARLRSALWLEIMALSVEYEVTVNPARRKVLEAQAAALTELINSDQELQLQDGRR